MTSPSPDEARLAEAVFGPRRDLAEQYAHILATTGVERGLLGPREVSRIWTRHLFNSVAVESLVPMAARVADVGSGAGLPGIPLAIARPDLKLVLLEPLLRRFVFLGETVEALGLEDQIDVLRLRAEDDDDVYDVVTCRAVAPLERLLGWCTPLFVPDGQLLALKGASAADEIVATGRYLAQARLNADLVTVRAHADTEVTHVVKVRMSARGAS